jgi:uncharacterized membrane protein YedE/YeeE
MGPLYKFGWFDFAYSLQLATLIGLCFGFVLERAGFGDPRKLTAIFYLRDFAVLKVMFTAIVVCMLGLLCFSVFGWIDLKQVYLLPTYLWPQIIGGLVLGIGFVMGGYCPTTSVVAAVSGKLDGLLFVFGMVVGSIVFAELFPLLEGLYSSGDMGAVRLTDVLGISSGLIAFLVCLMAVGAYWFVERVERRFGGPRTLPVGSKKIKRVGAALLVLLGLVLAIVNPDRIVAKRSPVAVGEEKGKGTSKGSTPKKGEEGTQGFRIVEDEGC